MIRSNNETYLGFYISHPFWAEERLDISDAKITVKMSEEVFKYSSNQGFTLKICRDGRFLFQLKKYSSFDSKSRNKDIDSYTEIWSTYLQYANAIALLFQLAFISTQKLCYFETVEVTHKEAFFETTDSQCIPERGSQKFCYARHPKILSDIDRAELFSMGRAIVYQETFDLLINNLETIFNNENRESLVFILSQLTKSILEYKLFNFDTSLVLAWFLIELIIQDKWDKWDKWLDSKNQEFELGEKRINADRKRSLNNQDFPISVKLNILELSESLSYETYKELDEIRKNRNKIAHRKNGNCLSIEKFSDTRQALKSLQKLLDLHFGFKIELDLNLTFHPPPTSSNTETTLPSSQE